MILHPYNCSWGILSYKYTNESFNQILFPKLDWIDVEAVNFSSLIRPPQSWLHHLNWKMRSFIQQVASIPFLAKLNFVFNLQLGIMISSLLRCLVWEKKLQKLTRLFEVLWREFEGEISWVSKYQGGAMSYRRISCRVSEYFDNQNRSLSSCCIFMNGSKYLIPR